MCGRCSPLPPRDVQEEILFGRHRKTTIGPSELGSSFVCKPVVLRGLVLDGGVIPHIALFTKRKLTCIDHVHDILSTSGVSPAT